MVIQLAAKCDALRLELLSALPVDVQASAGSRQRAILKDPAHVVEQVCDRQHHGWRAEAVLVFQEELCVLVSLSGGADKSRYYMSLAVGHFLSHQIQFAQYVLANWFPVSADRVNYSAALAAALVTISPVRYSFPTSMRQRGSRSPGPVSSSGYPHPDHGLRDRQREAVCPGRTAPPADHTLPPG